MKVTYRMSLKNKVHYEVYDKRTIPNLKPSHRLRCLNGNRWITSLETLLSIAEYSSGPSFREIAINSYEPVPLSAISRYTTPLSRMDCRNKRNLIQPISEEKEKHSMSLEKQLLSNLGIRGLINSTEAKAVSFGARSLKSKFGIEMRIDNPHEIEVATEWIQKYDKKFKNHIANPYVLSNIQTNPILNSCFILHVTKATYIYIDAQPSLWDRYEKNNDNGLPHYNPIYMYIFGRKCYAIFRILSNYIKSKIKLDEMIYSIVGSGDNNKSFWTCTASNLTPRTMDTIFMEPEQKQRIIDHLDNWKSSEAMYTARGLLYKTGILLYGVAGTGKSSLAIAIANYMRCGLVTIDPTTFEYMNIPEIVDSMVADETRYVVLIDEIDTIFKSRDDEDIDDKQKAKTAKLLSFLDSQQSPTNVIFVATTNYYDKLDPAVTRPGRFDLKEEMGNISIPIAREMCKSFDLDEEGIDEVISKFPSNEKINPSKLQDQILSYLGSSVGETEEV